MGWVEQSSDCGSVMQHRSDSHEMSSWQQGIWQYRQLIRAVSKQELRPLGRWKDFSLCLAAHSLCAYYMTPPGIYCLQTRKLVPAWAARKTCSGFSLARGRGFMATHCSPFKVQTCDAWYEQVRGPDLSWSVPRLECETAQPSTHS